VHDRAVKHTYFLSIAENIIFKQKSAFDITHKLAWIVLRSTPNRLLLHTAGGFVGTSFSKLFYVGEHLG